MNYFELFELAPTLRPDPVELRRKFFTLSRKFHPDYHVQQDAGEDADHVPPRLLARLAAIRLVVHVPHVPQHHVAFVAVVFPRRVEETQSAVPVVTAVSGAPARGRPDVPLWVPLVST
mgnify:CR=1 FL=1